MKTGVVTHFRDEYLFLSNFQTNPFTWRNNAFLTGEHAFQWAKGMYAKSIVECARHYDAVLAAPTPAKAKYAGRSVKIDVKAWDENKVGYMREIVHARFQTSEHDMVGQLINTGAMMLVEGNDWGDTFWGRCNGLGLNTLGVILMEERGYWLKSEFRSVDV